MSDAGQRYLSPIEGLRQDVTAKLAHLLESMVRSRGFNQDVAEMLTRSLAQLKTEGREQKGLAPLEQSILRLTREGETDWSGEIGDVRSVLLDFNRVALDYATTLVDKALLERQSDVLEKIILSHEKIAHWQDFVVNILRDFHGIFPFHFFFILFSEEEGLSLNIYYLGEFTPVQKESVRANLTQGIFRDLGLPFDTAIDYFEHDVADVSATVPIESMEAINTVTVTIPQHTPKLEGVLGVSFVSGYSLSAQEQSVVRSILAVLVMVVGSSKALSKTLAELEYYSVHDPLTGIHNRRYFNEVLAYEIDRSTRHEHEFGVVMVDLDNFKDINDAHGHPAGDSVLRQLACLMRDELRKADLVARLGGDEFGILLTETSPEDTYKVAEEMRRRIHDAQLRVESSTEPLQITASFGVASFPRDAQVLDDLYSGADIALYNAKAAGKDGVQRLGASGEQLKVSRSRRNKADELRTAIREDRVVPFFQPIVDAHGNIHGHEVLARLDFGGEHRSIGQYLDAATRYGLFRDIDRHIIRHAIHRVAKLQRHKASIGKLFFNISVQEMEKADIIYYTTDLCDAYGLSPADIVFELTEHDAVSDLTGLRRFLGKLRKQGFSFALDDFGTGYNSFHYLHELSFEYVKLDGAFVRNIHASRVDHALIKHLSALCSDLGMQTIAESIESEPLRESVAAMGIDFQQGFHIALPAARFAFEQ